MTDLDPLDFGTCQMCDQHAVMLINNHPACADHISQVVGQVMEPIHQTVRSWEQSGGRAE